MSNRKGFTLIEIIVALVIIGTLAAIALPSYNTMIIRGWATATQNNLRVIAIGQQNYYFNHGSYCYDTNNICGSLASINNNNNLSLNIADTHFNYTCGPNGGPNQYVCTAASNGSLWRGGSPVIVEYYYYPQSSNPFGSPDNPVCQGPSYYCPSN
jgi:prepilin-type N-terminal cleavage/methylation domain-containing protein